MIRPALPIKCPTCGATISWRHATPDVEFHCPQCGHGVRVRGNYFRVLNLYAIVILALILYAVGFRNDALFAWVILGLLPTQWILKFLTVRLFPPEVESTGDFRGILYGVHRRETDAPVLTESPEDRIETSTPPTDQPYVSMFMLVKRPRTLEGLLFLGGAIVFGAMLIWMAAEPFIYRIAPELAYTYNGPSSFPVTVHIGDSALALTNASTQPWSCKTELGFFEPFVAVWLIEPQHTREVPYGDFRRARGDVDAAVVRDAARGSLAITCVEPSGTTHFWVVR